MHGVWDNSSKITRINDFGTESSELYQCDNNEHGSFKDQLIYPMPRK